MYDFRLSTIICLFILPTGFTAEKCSHAVIRVRETVHVPEGGRLSLSCDVQHCGDTWTGMWIKSADEDYFQNSDRHSFTNVTLSANTTRLHLNFLNINKSDEGSYGCKATWGQSEIGQGHFIIVNVTAAVLTKRNLLHRLLICGCAALCLPIILGLAYCLSSGSKSQPVPRTQPTHPSEYRGQSQSAPKPPPRHPVPKKRTTFPNKAPSRPEQKTELVYVDISQEALRQQRSVREPSHSTVYSSVRFS